MGDEDPSMARGEEISEPNSPRPQEPLDDSAQELAADKPLKQSEKVSMVDGSGRTISTNFQSKPDEASTKRKFSLVPSNQLFRPPLFVENGPLQSETFGSPLQTHAADRSKWPLLFTANGDVQDLVYNDLLRFILPTYSRTHWLKFCIVTGSLLMALSWTLSQALHLYNADDDPEKDANPSQWKWFNILAVVEFAVLLVWIAYMLPTLEALKCDWMNPQVTNRNRMPIHVPLGMYSSQEQAREGSCQWDLPARPAYPESNIWRLDSVDADDKSWQFRLCQNVEQALAFVEQPNAADADDDANVWNPIVVPGNWMRQGYDKPIYTNMKYPWTCQPPVIPIKDNPTGIYKRKIELPPDWSLEDGTEYSIVMQGVESAFYLYWNGQKIGFSKDSRLPAEFDVTPFMIPGVNELTVVVIRWSDGSYVEDQDDWWLAGIHRSVELVRRAPGADILQYLVHAKADGALDVQVYCRSPPADKEQTRELKFALFEDASVISKGRRGSNTWKAGACLWEDTVNLARNVDSCSISARIAPVKQWTAETPHLYTLVIAVSYNKGHPTQIESTRVGFRTVGIKNGQVCVNGKPITIAGVNRHEHDPDNGKVVSIESMKFDVCLLKQNNFNSIRTSHYPNHSAFYRICDYYGMFVCDEANIETHGMKPMGRLAHCPGWEQCFVSRVARVVQRDYNHACVIFWSMGNEAGRGCNFVTARRIVQKLDNSRPIVYESGGALAEGSGRTEITDVVSTMYPDVDRTINLATRSDDDRPVILCEYSHSMGNSNGNIHLYWKEIWAKSVPRFQGGYIWDFVDQGMRVPVRETGSFFFAYGGDFGDDVNDKQFCINGLFSPDREPHPAVAEVKFLQQPVVFEPMEAHMNSKQLRITVEGRKERCHASVKFKVINRYSFRDLSHLTWSWSITSNRSTTPVRRSTFHLSTTEREQDVMINLDTVLSRIIQLERSRPIGGNSYFLNLRGRLKAATTWADAGHLVTSQQFPVCFLFEDFDIVPSKMALPVASDSSTLSPEIDDTTATIFWRKDGVKKALATFDKKTGGLVAYAPMGENILLSPMVLNLTRAATDNDRGGMELIIDFMFPMSGIKEIVRSITGGAEFSYLSHWSFAGLSQDRPPLVECTRFEIEEVMAGIQYTCKAECRIVHAMWGKTLFEASVHYTVYGNGQIKVYQKLVPAPVLVRVPSLPRIGIAMQLIPALQSVSYFGRGPGENYPDRKSGSEFGLYSSMTPTEMGYNYIVPSENGSRSDCEWMSFRSKAGQGLLVVADKQLVSFSALSHTANQLDKATHTCDLPSSPSAPISVNIDHRLMGIGGDVSWYPAVYPDYLVSSTDTYEYTLLLRPLLAEDDAALVARSV